MTAFIAPALSRPAIAILLAILLFSCFSSLAAAQWPTGPVVTQTFHNLTVPARNTSSDMAGLVQDYGEVCVYCHSPHGGRNDRPLWNRPLPSGPYRMFDPSDLDMIADPQPTGNSLSCLSCHDGTIGVDEILNEPNTYTGRGPSGTPIDECEGCHSGGSPKGGIDFEGVWFRPDDLRDSHPISMLYDPGRDAGFRSAAEIEAAGLKLYEGKVQCMTCHEPHSQRFRPFLRVGATGNTFCLLCHRTPPAEATAHHW